MGIEVGGAQKAAIIGARFDLQTLYREKPV